MWSRHFPAYKYLKEELKKGSLGSVKMVTANFGFQADDCLNGTGRLGDNKQGGGALLDVGIYTIQLANFVFGEKPEKIKASGIVTKFGK